VIRIKRLPKYLGSQGRLEVFHIINISGVPSRLEAVTALSWLEGLEGSDEND
jgi:hypothetical protein